MSPRARHVILRVLFGAVLVVALVYTVFPFYWALNTSLSWGEDTAFIGGGSPGGVSLSYVPIPPTVHSYREVFAQGVFVAALRNSVIVAGGATMLSLIVGALAACALGRYRFRGRAPVMYLILAMTMFPQIAVVGPLYHMVSGAGLFNTRTALILTYLLTTLPFTVWVLASFFRSLPRELEEAAYVDGATPFQTFWLVLLPLSAPGLVTTGLLAFINSWNEYLFALTFTLDEAARTVPPVVAQWPGQSQFQVPWGQIMAGSIIATLPLIVLVFIFQRRIVSGLTAGAVKG